jgi:hypothetical protein
MRDFMIDELIPMIEELQLKGAVVVLKWDGERSQNNCTVLISHKQSDYLFRRDTDDLAGTLRAALVEYLQR